MGGGETPSVGILHGERRDAGMRVIKKNDSEKPKEEENETTKSKTKKQNRLPQRHLGIPAFFLILEREPAVLTEVFCGSSRTSHLRVNAGTAC
jgi:hypothetical protein